MEQLREGGRDDLEANQKGDANRLVRMQAQRAFAEKLDFDVPESVQQQEMHGAVTNMVRSRRSAGETEEDIEKAKDQITAEANAAAIANAVYDAIGVQIRSLPFTPERVLRAIQEQR